MHAKQIVHSDRLYHRKIQAVSDRTSVVFESNLTFRNYSKIRMWIQNMDLALDDQVQKHPLSVLNESLLEEACTGTKIHAV
ncbi:hypothetical protein T08_6911 [Trichinella sp. T8]|nr:hypothetical protein T08_6911 [Trichinella sp. T8]